MMIEGKHLVKNQSSIGGELESIILDLRFWVVTIQNNIFAGNSIMLVHLIFPEAYTHVYI
jgi:hypothetical protein